MEFICEICVFRETLAAEIQLTQVLNGGKVFVG